MALTPTKLGGKRGQTRTVGSSGHRRRSGLAGRQHGQKVLSVSLLQPRLHFSQHSGSRQTGADAASPTRCGTGRSGCLAPTAGWGQQPQQLRCERLWGA